MTRQIINIGVTPNDGLGDSAVVGGAKINANFAELYTGIPYQRLDISNPNLTASFRDDGAGNLGWYVGAAGAGDGAQVKVATVDKATGALALAKSATIAGSLNLSAAGADTGTGVSLYFVGSGAFQTVLAGAAVAFNTGANGARVERARINATGFAVGTISPAATVHAVGINEVGRFEAANSEAYFVVNQSADPSVTGARPVFQLRKNNIVCLQVSAEGGVGALGQVYYEALGASSSHWFFGGSVRPGADNATALGTSGARWTTVYAATGTINTSDARHKVTDDGEEITEGTGWAVTPLSPAELRVGRRLAEAIGSYKFKDAVAEKGLEKARRHIGLTVQFALQVCEEEGVDPWAIGIFCRDQITRRVKVMQTVKRQKMEPVDPEAVIEIINGVPTRVLRERPPQPVVDMKPLIGLDGEPETTTEMVPAESGFPVEKKVPVLHPVPVMIEVEEEVEIDEPAGELLGFRYTELELLMIAGMAAEA